jgi:uncharacterized protein YsxB (DUF464 family)
MLKVRFTERGQKLSLRLEGHAEYAEIGKDIVCASASILAHILASDVKAYEQVYAYKTAPVVRLESGDTEITCSPSPDFPQVRCAYNFARKGFALLAMSYPDHVLFITDVKDE